MEKTALKTPVSMHLFVASLLILGVWLLLRGNSTGIFFVVVYAIITIFMINQKIILTDQALVSSSLLGKTIFPYTQIRKIELQYGLPAESTIKGNSGTLRLLINGDFSEKRQGINLSQFEPEHVFAFLKIFCERNGSVERDENIQAVLDGKSENLKKNLYKEAFIVGAKAGVWATIVTKIKKL